MSTTTDDTDDSNTEQDQAVANRSEIVFLYDAQDCNPNGNPMADNRPRIDPVTGQCEITDVRLKRYVRDQLQADGHPIFVKQPGGEPAIRAELALDLFDEVESVDDIDAIDDIRREFLARATDVRYFGATLSFNTTNNDLHEAVSERFPRNFTGPVQFSPARSINAVEENTESNSLTSVIATQEGKSGGGYALEDHRIKYGLFPFHGIVDEHGAADTNLSQRDVTRLDTLLWRALKNQPLSRSKFGQEPRLYVRVEYQQDGFHLGDLHTTLDIDTDHSKVDSQLRGVDDVCLDVSRLLETLDHHGDRIDTVHVLGSDRLSISDGEQILGSAADLGSLLASRGMDSDDVHLIDVYDEFARSLPDGDEDSTDSTAASDGDGSL